MLEGVVRCDKIAFSSNNGPSNLTSDLERKCNEARVKVSASRRQPTILHHCCYLKLNQTSNVLT